MKSKTVKNSSLPGPLSLLGETWKLYRRNIKIFTVLSLIASFSTFISSILSSLDEINIKSAPALVIPITIAAEGISFWGIVSMLYAILDEKNGINIKEAMLKGLKKLVPFFWLLILSVFITLGGFMLLVVPGIMLLVWLYLANFILVAENVGGMNALLKSREYIRGYFWAVAGRVLFILVINQTAFWASSYIFKLFHLPLYIVLIFNVIISIISIIFSLTYGFLLYKNLKSIKGEMTHGSSSKNKVFFIICGILGAIIPIISIILYLIFLFVIPSSLNKSQKSQTTPFNFKLNDSALVANRKLIQAALDKYYSDHGLYPSSLENLVPKYLSSVPWNPVTRKQYKYVSQDNGKKYKLCLGIPQDVCYVPWK